MKPSWKSITVIALVASHLQLAVPAYALEELSAVSVSHELGEAIPLTKTAKAHIVGVLQEKHAQGWTLAAVIKLTNTTNRPVRVPDYELRGRSSHGTDYTLMPSAANKTSISPFGYVELVYYTTIDAQEELAIEELAWIDVQWDVYPKRESVMATAPVQSLVWRGSDSEFAALQPWGEPFRLPGGSQALEYTPIRITRQYSGQQPSYSVQLLAENTGSHTEKVPVFTLGGKTETNLAIGSRVSSEFTLNSGEKKYLDFVISPETDQTLKALYVMKTESYLPKSYVPAGTAQAIEASVTTPVPIQLGQLGIELPAGSLYGTPVRAWPAYTKGESLLIDPINQSVNPHLTAALLSVDWFENEGQNYKTAVAKVKYTNTGSNPIPLPALGAQLTNSQQTVYQGVAVDGAVKEVYPRLGAVVSYTFALPQSEAEDGIFGFELTEKALHSDYQIPVAKAGVTIDSPSMDTVRWTLVPYEIDVTSWSLSMVTSQSARGYSFNHWLKLGLDIRMTDVASMDAGESRLYMELVNSDGKRVSSKTFALTGDNRLLSGNQSIDFSSTNPDRMEWPLTVKVYEAIQTPLGEARRLIAELKK